MNNTLEKMLEALTPDVYQRLKQAIEIRKWPDGRNVSEEQLQLCMQAVIAYEHKNLPPEQRTGYVPPKTTPCENKHDDETLKWQ